MNARASQQTKELADTMNAADYVDALLRPKTDRIIVSHERIKGRRMRDQYLDQVTLTRIVEPQA